MIKKFIASTVDKAQSKARKALGKSVVILNIRDLPSGDVEVMAADEQGARDYYEVNPAPPILGAIDDQGNLSPIDRAPADDGHRSAPDYQEAKPRRRGRREPQPDYFGTSTEDSDPYASDAQLGQQSGHAPSEEHTSNSSTPRPMTADGQTRHHKQSGKDQKRAGKNRLGGIPFLNRRRADQAPPSAEDHGSEDYRPEDRRRAPQRGDPYFEPDPQNHTSQQDDNPFFKDRGAPPAPADAYQADAHPEYTDYPVQDANTQNHTPPGRTYDPHQEPRIAPLEFDREPAPDPDPRGAPHHHARPPSYPASRSEPHRDQDHQRGREQGHEPDQGRAYPPISSPVSPSVSRPVHAQPLQARPSAPRAEQSPNSGSRLNEPLEQKFSENALNQLRERLTGQRAPGDIPDEDGTTSSIAALLKPHGISDRLLTMIRNGARKVTVEDDLYRLGIGLSEAFNFSPLRSTAAVPLMLVGPTGAGKTSCAAKLAALALAEGEAAMMITTDVGRAGALEQFTTYSEKLNIECYAAETPEEIATIMHEARPQGAVILDTPGISPYDAGDLAALKSYQTAIGAEPVLVLPASGDMGEYTDWAHAFRAFGVRSCIITKFDATRRVGAGLSAAFEGNMTLTYFSETPFISEGLLPASPEFLAYRLTASYPGRIVQA